MLKKFIAWREEHRAWRRDHISSFRAAAVKDESGLTAFQTECARRLSAYVAPNAFVRDSGANGVGLSARVHGTGAELNIFDLETNIYGDGHDIRFEEWNFRTPEDLINATENALQRVGKQLG